MKKLGLMGKKPALELRDEIEERADADAAFDYAPLPGIADEMVDNSGAIRPVWQRFLAHLNLMDSIKAGTSVKVDTSTTATSKSYKVTVNSSYAIPTTPLIGVLGYKTMNIGASSSTSSGTSDTKTALSMELVLDQSGSMGDKTSTCATYDGTKCKTYVIKIDALKKAASALFTALNTADPDHNLVRTGAYSYNNGLIYKDAKKTQIKSMKAGPASILPSGHRTPSAFPSSAISTIGTAAATSCASAPTAASGKSLLPMFRLAFPTNSKSAVRMASFCR